ncbi:hypothetical protein E8E15_009584 [Penicillium rubens]|uniref:Pc14g00730 protein n=1 Tax=Penicillium rubens (strain ATCC 28089 / DSM 1075 / NRRL 1951 / Wisconsin 54-1255) TaxID=500485 RepID=B6H5P6_PENRW|nr:uncharacterized protein N7525_000071 [Penicillium rubens]KAF3024649.1 hypothetical protein E8E15_009584 [Penicillium rubens]KAJ5842330.1 hypothetical protein N7525_000071 [Penicillium rubens]KAJ5847094.1 hypothetical protein N7534_010763 [Penicillium rubens]CAP74214.1 Pc14g00730 [Penicillium rubens Wisconsin 54-1255]
MAVGGCFCGKVRIEYSGQPLASALCHCLDCRKLTGGPYSFNYIVQTAELHVSGNPKEVPKTSDSGNEIKNYFCPDCGTPLYGLKIKPNGDRDETTVIRAGILDNVGILHERTPVVEIYTEQRLKWVSPIEGADQFTGMLPLP